MSERNEDNEFTLDLDSTSLETSNNTIKKKSSTIKFLGKMLPVIVVIGAISYTSAYLVTNKKLDANIEKKLQEIEQISAEVDKADAETISSSEIPAEVLEKAINISVQADTVPQELIEPSKDNSIQNDNGWYLVDTDGDSIGDAYWGITKDDIVAETYGKMYVYSYTDRQYIKHVLREADPKNGIEELYEMIPDPNQVIPPNVLVPAQFVKTDTGTILSYDKLG